MATRKSIRSVRNSARSDGNRPKSHPSSHAPGKRGARASARKGAADQNGAILGPLILVALRLKVIYGTALSVELALRHQDAEQDIDIAECLRAGVCDPVADQVRQIQSIVNRLGGELPEALL